MIALKITEIKEFMGKLLKGSEFDAFCVVEASITTYNTFTIDGCLHRDFFDPQTAETLKETGRTYSLWEALKPFCFSIIRGKRTPLHFKIVFQLSKENMAAVLTESGAPLLPQDINGLYLNVTFHGDELTCTTGTSYRIFTMDKNLDNAWDLKVMAFFRQHGIAFIQL